jgi:hypothetical protein
LTMIKFILFNCFLGAIYDLRPNQITTK